MCDLRRLTYAKMKECIDAPPNDGTTIMVFWPIYIKQAHIKSEYQQPRHINLYSQ